MEKIITSIALVTILVFIIFLFWTYGRKWTCSDGECSKVLFGGTYSTKDDCLAKCSKFPLPTASSTLPLPSTLSDVPLPTASTNILHPSTLSDVPLPTASTNILPVKQGYIDDENSDSEIDSETESDSDVATLVIEPVEEISYYSYPYGYNYSYTYPYDSKPLVILPQYQQYYRWSPQRRILRRRMWRTHGIDSSQAS
jgi:hypothetical protein